MFKPGYHNTLLQLGIIKVAETSTVLKLVDGGKVRDDYSNDFALGGHYYRYKFIPENEIWVERGLGTGKDGIAVIIHEGVERALMKNKGMGYEAGHAEANKVEKKFRKLVG